MQEIKRILYTFLIAAVAVLAVRAEKGKDAKGTEADSHVYTVVIDPGHGGKDTGCSGAKTKEKDVNLAVAKLLADKIEKKYGDEVNVVMTRDKDVFVSLQRRSQIANDAKGDLFISIHVNSVDKKNRKRSRMQGASVYTCGLHKNESNLKVAMAENSVMELEADYTTTYQGFDPNSSESYIIFELSQNLYQHKSIDFATLAQDELTDYAGRADMGVRQAGFWVLWATYMPSVLVELDYMCNPTQEKFLNSAAGREKCAEALFRAFNDYYDKTTE